MTVRVSRNETALPLDSRSARIRTAPAPRDAAGGRPPPLRARFLLGAVQDGRGSALVDGGSHRAACRRERGAEEGEAMNTPVAQMVARPMKRSLPTYKSEGRGFESRRVWL